MTSRNPERISNIVIGSEHIDWYNHVNHPAYLTYFETERWALIKEYGITLKSLMEDHGLMVVIADFPKLRYPGSAREGDLVQIRTELVDINRFIVFDHEMTREGRRICEATVRNRVVRIGGGGINPPQFLVERLKLAKFDSYL